MILKNRYFGYSLGFVTLQQILIALSTYAIASAGAALAHQQNQQVITFVIAFFGFALTGYLLSSVVELFSVKLRNDLWIRYTLGFFEALNNKMSLSSQVNKERATHWLSGEALSTLETTSQLCITLASMLLNIVLTFFVFYLTLGKSLCLVMAMSMVFSSLMVHFLKRKIKTLSRLIQQSKLKTFTKLSIFWDSMLFATPEIKRLTRAHFQKQARIYFNSSQCYALYEQVIACLPIGMTTLLIILTLSYQNTTDALILGSLVAVLPRTLQLLGNIHGLSLTTSKLLLYKYKMNNLNRFMEKLKPQSLIKQIKHDQINLNDERHASFSCKSTLADYLSDFQKHNPHGRLTLTGANGSGKTSLLKIIKEHNEQAILLTPDTQLCPSTANLSKGEGHIQQILFALEQPITLLLLDEWDANLDKYNIEKIDTLINTFSQHAVVIEVRHKSS